ncbi:MAG: hypothetical protein LBC69_02065 [Eubacteriaceae bacterium]|jgi:hypothetical protein|nr:hypothetical protein [Eubacteriaceae bacterium]
MDRLETLKRAKEYIDSLAVGVDPITKEKMPEDATLANVRLARCFFFVSDVLQEAIANAGAAQRAGKGPLPFRMAEEEKERVEISQDPVQITKFCERVNACIDPGSSGKLKVAAFGKWLVKNGMLAVVEIQGKSQKSVTEAGKALGINAEPRNFDGREYISVTYSEQAQRFLLSHLDEIADISNGKQA